MEAWKAKEEVVFRIDQGLKGSKKRVDSMRRSGNKRQGETTTHGNNT